ncbi:hypothetical protein pipiens_019880 [Culex pipiens pipiens]|uniref:F-box domain-containing protein n=1 Tax=Culex pipiens pipiens TaxID=38569 RepID=A0ABD1DUR1_CULPP
MELRSGMKVSRPLAHDSSNRKRARLGDAVPAADLCPHLPTELLEMIFRTLDKKSLLRIRLTCRRWREIVDRKQICETGRNLPNLKKVYVRVAQDGTKIPSFLASMVQITDLQIIGVGSPSLNFYGHKTPNLRVLDLKTFDLAQNCLQSYLKYCQNLQLVGDFLR